jgi:hypothetical protein
MGILSVIANILPTEAGDFLLRVKLAFLWRLRSDPPRKLSYFVKHFVGSYSIAGMLVMLLGAIAEKEIYIPSSAVIAESSPKANTHFLVHTFFPVPHCW